MEVEGHDTEDIELQESDDEAIHFAVGGTTDPKTAKALIVFLRGRWTIPGAKDIYNSRMTKGSMGFKNRQLIPKVRVLTN